MHSACIFILQIEHNSLNMITLDTAFLSLHSHDTAFISSIDDISICSSTKVLLTASLRELPSLASAHSLIGDIVLSIFWDDGAKATSPSQPKEN